MQIHESLDAIRDQLCECHKKYPTLRVAKLFQSDVPQDVLRGYLGRSIAEYTQTLYEEPPLTSDGQAYREVLDSWIYFPGQTGLPSELGSSPPAAIREHEDRCLGEVQSVFGKAAALLYSGSFQGVQGVLGTTEFVRWDHWLNALFIVAEEDTIDMGLQVIDQTNTIIANCRSNCATHNWDALEDAKDFETEILCGCDKTEARSGWIHVLEPSVFAASIQLVDYLQGSLPVGKGTAETPERPTNASTAGVLEALSGLQIALAGIEHRHNGPSFEWQSVQDAVSVVRARLAATESLDVDIQPAEQRKLVGLLNELSALYHLDSGEPIIGPPDERIARLVREAIRAFTPDSEGLAVVPIVDNTLALSENKQDILKALLEENAIDSDKRKTAVDIAIAVAGKTADVNAFKEPLADLVRSNFLLSKTGRGGGYWLTQAGIDRAKKQ